MSSNTQRVLAGVQLNFQSKPGAPIGDSHSLSFHKKTGSAISSGVLETYVILESNPFSFSAFLTPDSWSK